jgi:hypothetical protein
MEKDTIILQLSKHLFWDVDYAEQDVEKNKSFIIKRVLEYGLYADWILIKDYFGIKKIAEQATLFKDLDPRAHSFIANLSGIPKNEFRCYTTKQLNPAHWNF